MAVDSPLATIDSLVMPGRGYRFNVVQAAAGQLGAKDHRVEDYWRAALGVDWHGAFPPHWCGAFALWALKQAGMAADRIWTIAGCWPRHDSKGYGFLLVGEKPLKLTERPQPGDISYRNVPYRHHAIVESVDADGTVHTIDGNQGPPLFIKRASHRLTDAAYDHFSISRLIDEAEAVRRAA